MGSFDEASRLGFIWPCTIHRLAGSRLRKSGNLKFDVFYNHQERLNVTKPYFCAMLTSSSESRLPRTALRDLLGTDDKFGMHSRALLPWQSMELNRQKLLFSKKQISKRSPLHLTNLITTCCGLRISRQMQTGRRVNDCETIPSMQTRLRQYLHQTRTDTISLSDQSSDRRAQQLGKSIAYLSLNLSLRCTRPPSRCLTS